MRIVIISHTEHYYDSNGQVCGWGSTIRELNHVAAICDELIHIAPIYDSPAPESSLHYRSDKIKFIPLKPSGGKGLQKLSILTTAWYNLKKIHKHTKSADYIQFRAPTGMGLYVLPYLKLVRPKRYWVKYAGNWIDPDMPFGNRLQKIWLKYLDHSVKVTINGTWEQDSRFLAFENPSLTQEEFNLGQCVVRDKIKKMPTQFRLIFVGSLNRHKGVHLILEALMQLDDYSSFAELLFVGDGVERAVFETMARRMEFPIRFLGHRSKSEVAELLAQSHILLLPSKSEGFPKVVGEAMNFGCIPVVSKVSCIGDYVKEGSNGFLIESLSGSHLKNALVAVGNWQESDYQSALRENVALAKKFTYQHYNQALLSSVLNHK